MKLYDNMATNQHLPSESKDIITSEFQTYDEGIEPGLDLSASEIEDIIKFMKEDLGITNPLSQKKIISENQEDSNISNYGIDSLCFCNVLQFV